MKRKVYLCKIEGLVSMQSNAYSFNSGIKQTEKMARDIACSTGEALLGRTPKSELIGPCERNNYRREWVGESSGRVYVAIVQQEVQS